MRRIITSSLMGSLKNVRGVKFNANGQVVERDEMFDSMHLEGKVRMDGPNGAVAFLHNNTVFGGRRFLLEKIFGKVPQSAQQLTLEKILGLSGTPTIQDASSDTRTVCLFGVGIGGSGLQFGAVNMSSENDNNLFEIIPMRTTSTTLDGEDAETYFVHKKQEINGSQMETYYLKAANAGDINVYLNNHVYTPSVEDNTKTNRENTPSEELSLYNIQVIAILPIEISVNDIKEYFKAKYGNLTLARFNELGLFIGQETTVNGVKEYRNVECFSHLTFNNRPMDNDGAKYGFKYYVIA